jgi:exopolysaccharide biosynthesis polyprenyl glycosylphosphotransferase
MPQELGSTLVGQLRVQPVAPPVAARPLRIRPRREWSLLIVADVTVVAAVSLGFGGGAPAALIRAAGIVLAFAVAGLYRPRLRYSALDGTARMLLGVGAVMVLGPAAGGLAAGVALAIGVTVGRALAYAAVAAIRRRGRGIPTLVVGSGETAALLAETLHEDPAYGLAPIGLVGPPPVREPALPAPLLGPVDELDAVLARCRPGAVIVAFPGVPDAALVGTLRHCRRLGTVVYLVPRLFELGVGGGDVELVNGVPLLRMQPEPPRRWRGAVKRAMDLCGAAAGLLLLWPVFAICALAVRWESGRAGVLFRQERIGLDGRPFTILKFRSLTPASDVESQVRWNIADDQRVGPVGRVLRGTSLDELPQLLNVLRGQMSLVGPRPERPYFVEQFTRMYDGYPDRHRVPGGITGWAQIHGLRGDTSIADRVRFDNYYVENWSPVLDAKIIVRTVGSMLSIGRR